MLGFLLVGQPRYRMGARMMAWRYWQPSAVHGCGVVSTAGPAPDRQSFAETGSLRRHRPGAALAARARYIVPSPVMHQMSTTGLPRAFRSR